MSDLPPARAGRRAQKRAARRAGRRAGSRRQIDSSIPSPCISVCEIDDISAECIGCRRTIDEIRDWIVMTAEEKKAVLANIARRKAGAGDEP